VAMIDPLDPHAVHDLESFFAFVRALIADRAAAVEAEKQKLTPFLGLVQDAGGWYNVTIQAYLEAALGWAEDTGMGESQGLPIAPSWEAFAAFLYCGKIYE
jgi:hypothetical protein